MMHADVAHVEDGSLACVVACDSVLSLHTLSSSDQCHTVWLANFQNRSVCSRLHTPGIMRAVIGTMDECGWIHIT